MKITPVTQNKSLVTIYSCGANPGHDALPKDFLGDYLTTVFAMVGFTNPHMVRLQKLPKQSAMKNLLSMQ